MIEIEEIFSKILPSRSYKEKMLDENFALKRFFLRLFGACVDLMFMIDDWFKRFFHIFRLFLYG